MAGADEPAPDIGARKFWMARWGYLARWSVYGAGIALALDAGNIYVLHDTGYLGGAGLAGAAGTRLVTMLIPSVFFPSFPLMEKLLGGSGRTKIDRWRSSMVGAIPFLACWASVGQPLLAMLARLLRGTH